MFNIFRILLAATLLLSPELYGATAAGPQPVVDVDIHGTATPTFTLDQAILTALQQNPDILRARQEIERTKGIYLEFRAQALPRIDGTANFQDTDPHLTTFTSEPMGRGATPGPTASPIPGSGRPFTITTGGNAERQYTFNVQATQVVFSGGRIVSQIRAADFQRDSSYFAFRSTVDTIVSTVKQQWYQVVLNRELIKVQEESVNLLQSQLQDQQNRFDAGTVPRFNVLQAQVALSNQIPQLITAQNNYRISKLTLAKTLGIDFNPNRADLSPIEVAGELIYEPRQLPIKEAIEVAKANRPFLKQQKANVLSSAEQVRVQRSGFFPQISGTAGGEYRSSPFSDNIRKGHTGYVFGGTGTWAIWDWGETWGRMKQARAVREQAKITYDDAGRQVELEVQQAFSNMQQGRELIQSQEKNVEQADEARRLAQARLDAGAGTQLELLDARVQLTTAQSTKLQALFQYNVAVAEFDRVTATEITYSSELDEPSTRRKLKTDAVPTPAPKPTPLPLMRMTNPPGALR